MKKIKLLIVLTAIAAALTSCHRREDFFHLDDYHFIGIEEWTQKVNCSAQDVYLRHTIVATVRCYLEVDGTWEIASLKISKSRKVANITDQDNNVIGTIRNKKVDDYIEDTVLSLSENTSTEARRFMLVLTNANTYKDMCFVTQEGKK